MLRRPLTAAAALAATAGLAACGSTGSSSGSAGPSGTARPTVSSPATASGPAAKTVLCDAAVDLRTSLTALQQVDVGAQGTDALAQAFTQVKTDLATLSDAARSQYTAQVQKVKADAAAVQAAVDAAKAAPSSQAIGAAAAAARLLVQDGQALVTSVGSSC